jgi:hypothetical protein
VATGGKRSCEENEYRRNPREREHTYRLNFASAEANTAKYVGRDFLFDVTLPE